MIWWLFGNTGAGKTTLSKKLSGIHLDGDEMRATISADLGYSEADRRENNLRIARLAKLLESKGYDVIVSTICPYPELRKEVFWITKCRFVQVMGEFKSEV